MPVNEEAEAGGGVGGSGCVHGRDVPPGPGATREANIRKQSCQKKSKQWVTVLLQQRLSETTVAVVHDGEAKADFLKKIKTKALVKQSTEMKEGEKRQSWG